MNTILTQNYSTPLGSLILGAYDNTLCLCDWQYRKMRPAIDKRIQSELNAEYEAGEHPIFEETKKQFAEYFSGERTTFDIALHFAGSNFQKNVWKELMKIPYGETCSYLQLAQRLGDEKAVRAVATANGANAISIIVPCHRVIGSDGKLTGYAGGLQVKRKLLKLEGRGNKTGQLELFD
jgi:methylated-DNA-[protein]-cysteine S-methyltransferase